MRRPQEVAEWCAIVARSGCELQLASGPIRAHHEVALAAVQETWRALRYVDPELYGNRDILLAALRQDRSALEFATEALLSDSVFVLTAMQELAWPELLLSVDTRLRKDREMMLAAVKLDGLMLQHAVP